MKYIIGVQLITTFIIATGTLFAQSVSTVPSDTGNDRFLEEYHVSIIRPGLSLNGFDNGGNDSKGLGLKQVLNGALSGNEYLKDKLNAVFFISGGSFNDPVFTDGDIEENSRILQYTAFEALASYVLEHNGIDSVDSKNAGLNIRSHAVAVADLRQK